jgi:hypothetical protein
MASKAPVNVAKTNEDNEVIEIPFAEYAKIVTKEFKIKPLKNDQGQDVKTPLEIVSYIFAGHNSDVEGNFELPEELEHLSDLSDAIRQHVQEHKQAVLAKKAQKDTEKEQKKQEREASKAEKEAQEKEFQKNQQAFQDMVSKQISKYDSAKADKVFKDTMNSISLPKSIALADNGMGVVISSSATKNDIALATSAYLNGLQGTSSMASALQFGLGDLLLGAVKAGVYRNKGDAAQAVKVNILEATGKRFSAGAINFYSLMSERVPVEKRNNNIAPSIYLEASKITAPRIKEGTVADNEKLSKEFDAVREEAIEKINSGELKGVKEVKAFAKSFREEKGLIKDSGPTVSDYLKDFFLASWIKEYITPDKDENFTFAIKDSPKRITMHVGELTSRLEDAKNNLQNMLFNTYDVDALLKGEVTKGKGDKAETLPYFLIDPFGQAEDLGEDDVTDSEQSAK